MTRKKSRKKSKAQNATPIGVSPKTPKPTPPPKVLTRWQKFRMRWLGK